MDAAIQAADGPARRAAELLGGADDWVFLGSGPSYATALFSAAKLVESCGANAWGQDIEEWAHIQYFNAQERTPTCLIAPPGRSLDRALELFPHLKSVGRHTLAVTSVDPATLPVAADTFLPVPVAVPEPLTPLAYCLAGELLACHLAEIRNTRFFQPTGGASGAGDRLRESRIRRRIDDLAGATESGAAHDLTTRTRWLLLSAMYRLPRASTQQPCGRSNPAAVAGPPSPPPPCRPPATVVTTPVAASIRRMAWFSVSTTSRLPCASQRIAFGDPQVAASAAPPSPS